MAKKIREKVIFRRALIQASQQRFFLASALSYYQLLHQINDDQLAILLECPPQVLPRLALCRRPDPMAPTFLKDVDRIAIYAGVNGEHLLRILREVDVLETLQGAKIPNAQGMLLAARDHDQGGKTSNESDHDSLPESDPPSGKR